MDLGTANTIIISDGKVLVDEPSVVALDRRTEKMIAVGGKAKMMYEKTNPDIRTIRPLRDGVIADFNACEQMMRGLIKKIHTGTHLFTPSLKMVLVIPKLYRKTATKHIIKECVLTIFIKYRICSLSFHHTAHFGCNPMCTCFLFFKISHILLIL